MGISANRIVVVIAKCEKKNKKFTMAFQSDLFDRFKCVHRMHIPKTMNNFLSFIRYIFFSLVFTIQVSKHR